MSFVKKMEKGFIALVFLALIYIGYSWYQSQHFKNNPLSLELKNKILIREDEVHSYIRKHFKTLPPITMLISDEFSSRLYGLTQFKEGKLVIYLNKKRFKESEAYMLDEVIPHEYAHAMVFALGLHEGGDGHTKIWQDICLKLDGKTCQRYVDNEEIIAEKLRF